MLEPHTQSTLDDLFEQLCEGKWDAELAGRFDEVLLGNPDAQRYYLEQSELLSSLRWHAASEQTRQAIGQLRAAGMTPASNGVARPATLPRRATFWFAAAASVAVAFGIATWATIALLGPGPAAPQPIAQGPDVIAPPKKAPEPVPSPALERGAVVGRVVLAADVRHTEGHVMPAQGDPVHTGTLHWQQGRVRIELDSGVLLTVEGPAEIELVDGMQARLGRGRMTAYVPPRAVGYRVVAADLTVTDLGADFGLDRDEKNRVRLAVFRGEVQATLDSRYLGMTERMRLTRNDGLEVDREGSVTTSILGDDSRFTAIKQALDRHVPHVVNGSFEHPRTADQVTAAAVGWELMAHPLANADRMDIQAGVIRAGHAAVAPGNVPPARDGDQWAYLNTRTFPDGRTTYTSMHQAVGLIVAGSKYRLRATIARPLDGAAASYTIGLYAGAAATGPQTPLKQWTDPAVPGPQKSVQIELFYESPADSPYRDDELFLVIQAVPAARPGIRQVLVDEVQLEIVPRTDPPSAEAVP